ncbi:helix-turn-helix domain-containing protein [Allokutzneria oryzae]|uniref:Helix-turn-helix domain-containing protein n=1 Tax=Allokutzneria oryzae TaxID=1378989 RepID=A0ABV5ZPR7_9PSEU
MATVQTLPRKQLGMLLRDRRKALGMDQDEIATALGKNKKQVIKIESGAARLSETELETILDLLQVHGRQRETIADIGRHARARKPRAANRPYARLLPPSFLRVADMETEASHIYSYAPGIVPVPLQAPGYMQAIFSGDLWFQSEEEVTSRIRFRQERQTRVLQLADPKTLEIVFTSDALAAGPDDRDIMCEQLRHLLTIQSEHPSISIQVMEPKGVRNPAPDGGLTLLSFETAEPEIAFMPPVYGPSSYVEDRQSLDTLFQIFRRTQQLALDVEATTRYLKAKLREYGS